MKELSKPTLVSVGLKEVEVLKIKDLNAGYGDVQVLWGINLQVEEGKVTSLIGSNGAGKSTLLKTISGLIRPMRGEIQFYGKRISDSQPESIVRQGITQIPEGRRLFPRMSVEENLLVGAYIRKDDRIEPLFGSGLSRLGNRAIFVSYEESSIFPISLNLVSAASTTAASGESILLRMSEDR